MAMIPPGKEQVDAGNAPEQFQTQILADRLTLVSLALFVIYATTTITSLLPLYLLDPVWQLKSIAKVVESAALPLLGLGLLHLSTYLNPQNLPLKQKSKTAARLAMVAALGFLLICPLQIAAAWSTYSDANTTVEQQEARATETARAVRAAIRESQSHKDLQRRLRDLQRPDLRLNASTYDLQSIPLPILKSQLLAKLNEAEVQAKKSFKRPDPSAVQGLAVDSLKTIVISFFLAVAFAACAQRKGSDVPWLLELHTMWALRGIRRTDRDTSKHIVGIPISLKKEIADEGYFNQLIPDEEAPKPPEIN